MQNRVEKIMKVIENNNLDAVALIAGPNLTYLTGADFHLMERPTVLIFSKNYKPVAILPNLEVDSFKALNFYKEVSDSHKNIYKVVQKANEIGRNITKIGTSLHDVDDAVTGHLEQSVYRKCIGHRTGHGLGMDVHEDPYVTRGNKQKLAKGMVITIEPGLYDVGNVGIRIEDNVLVTENGHESLTVLPRDLTII